MIPVADPLRIDEDELADIYAAMALVSAKGPLVLGEWVEQFEALFASSLVGAAKPLDVVGVGSGTDALVIALQTLELPPRSHVLVPPNDGGFGACAVAAAGLIAIPVDVDERSSLVTAQTLADVATPQTAAIIVTHLHGLPAEMAAIDRWRRSRGLAMIEDCAQAHGARVGEVSVGCFGDAATFSFYPTKNLGALGDGGAIAFADREMAARARSLRMYGWGERYRIEVASGRNSRLDALQAAVLSARLRYLDENNRRRRHVAARYQHGLTGSGSRILSSRSDSVAHHAVIVDERRDELADHLEARGISTLMHYPWLITEMPGLSGVCLPAELPVATSLQKKKLTLPCFPSMSESEIEYVESALREWVA